MELLNERSWQSSFQNLINVKPRTNPDIEPKRETRVSTSKSHATSGRHRGKPLSWWPCIPATMRQSDRIQVRPGLKINPSWPRLNPLGTLITKPDSSGGAVVGQRGASV
ncbi:hypothetical protein QLX08_002780 [Tetragonisca angustula]|uniref:Uncharacterized protein n=1 Tax=Tetragonisca angustula TaxID=166442 RepID=A0AAW1A9C9_9HYME